MNDKANEVVPVQLTFYDRLLDYPYTCKVYITDNKEPDNVLKLIESIQALSICVLSKCKIGDEVFGVPDYQNKLKDISPYAMGTSKWRILAYDIDQKSHSFTIPGYNPEQLASTGKYPDRKHPAWQTFLELFVQICVSKTGKAFQNQFKITISIGKYPPEGAK